MVEKLIRKKRCELGLYWRRCGGLPTKDFMSCVEFNLKNEESVYVVYVGKLKTPRLIKAEQLSDSMSRRSTAENCR